MFLCFVVFEINVYAILNQLIAVGILYPSLFSQFVIVILNINWIEIEKNGLYGQQCLETHEQFQNCWLWVQKSSSFCFLHIEAAPFQHLGAFTYIWYHQKYFLFNVFCIKFSNKVMRWEPMKIGMKERSFITTNIFHWFKSNLQ